MSQPRNLQHEFYDMLMESQYWLPETMLAYQRSQLSQLLRHARANVPFYEKRLDAVFTATGDINWDRWSEIPIVTRADMAERRESMLAREVPKGHGYSGTNSSSGSSGIPIQITNNRLTVLAANANRWRSHRWHNLDWSQVYAARDGVSDKAAWPSGELIGPWGPPWETNAAAGRAFRLSRMASLEQSLDFITRTGAAYFSTGPKTLHAMALEAERLGMKVALDCVLVHGEGMDAADAAAIRRAFGARTLEHYSSKEAGQMAYPCPDAPGFHINAESVLVEIVDESGNATPAGSTGRVVVTPFYSTAQPLIRYDQGDLAMAGRPCGCGRGLPHISSIEGRRTVIFTHPDGRSVAKLLPETARQALRCTFWQIAQVGPLAFEIRYVPGRDDDPADEKAAEDIFRRQYFDDVELAFVATAHIPLTDAGKHVEYVNEWSRRRQT